MQDSVNAVRLHCEELLNSNVKAIKESNEGKDALKNLLTMELQKKVDGLKEEVKGLQKKISGLKADNNNSSLRKVQVLLGLAAWSEDGKREKFKSHAWDVERERGHQDILETLDPERISVYKRTVHFQHWLTSSRSAMLFIIGATNPGQRWTHCWMSPLAIDIVRQHDVKDNPHAYHIFAENDMTIYSAITEILFQLLRTKRSALGENDYFAKLCAIIEKYNAISESHEEAKVDALIQVVGCVVQIFESNETVHVTLDRVDLCKTDQQPELMRVLITMLETAKCFMKIFAVAKDMFWEVDKRSLPKTTKGYFEQVFEEQRLTI
ncbi:MAG: hypothetical protein M1821_002403 [Bathelium mastoideum]|nr:MAG: hypothetical protein M1821_002403 [Bathelium mastoideum]